MNKHPALAAIISVTTMSMLLALAGCGSTSHEVTSADCSMHDGSDLQTCTVTTPDHQQVTCIRSTTNHGGISCDWPHATDEP